MKSSKKEVLAGRDVLEPEGWSVPVRAGVSALGAEEDGVALASGAETRKAIAELKGNRALAVLCSVNVDQQGTEVHVLVKDAQGRQQARTKFLFQFGCQDVTCMCDAPKRTIVQDTVRVVLSLSRAHTETETWEYAQTAGGAAAKKWLEIRAKAKVLETQRPTRAAGVADALQVVATVALADRDKVLKASGLDGVFTRPFFNGDSEKNEFKTAPFPLDTDLEAARRKAAFFGDRAYGVITNAKGFALRVKSDAFEEALKQVNPTAVDRFSGEKWEISGLPLDMGEQGLLIFLEGWKVKPVYTFRQGSRRTWVVRADVPPVINKIRHDDGLALIKRAVQSFSSTIVKERWQPAKKTSASSQIRGSAAQGTPKAWGPSAAPLPKAASNTPSTETASPAAGSQPPKVNILSLQETIAATIAAAMVPFQEHLDRLNANMQMMQSLQSPMLVDEDQGQKRAASSAEVRPPLRLRIG